MIIYIETEKRPNTEPQGALGSLETIHSVAFSIRGLRSVGLEARIVYIGNENRPNTEPQGAPGVLDTMIQ